MNGYLHFVIRRALVLDSESVIYDWFPFPTIMETIILWSNGVISQHWSFMKVSK